MAKKKFSFSNIVKIFLQIMELSKTSSSFSFIPCILILLYFIQIFSYVLKFKWYFEEEKINFLAQLFFYLNFPNCLLFFKNYALTLLFYILSIVYVYYFYLYLLLLAIFEKFIKKTPILMKAFRYMNEIFAVLFRFHFWVFLLPSLEMIINPLFCDINASYFSCEEKLGLPFVILSIFGIILNLLLGLSYLLVYKSYGYLDLNEIKFNGTFLSIICYILRVCLPLLFPFFGKNYPFVYYFCMLLIGVASFLDYLVNMPIRSPIYNKFYLICLFFFFVSSFIFTITAFSDILIEPSLFILIWVLSIIAIKLGINSFFKIRFNLISNELQNREFLDFSLEEISLCFDNHKTSVFDYYMMLGMLKKHAKNCKEKKCKLTNKHMIEFENLNISRKEQRINAFIAQSLKIEIQNKRKKNDLAQMEKLVLKYFSFIVETNENVPKTIYEIKKLSNLSLQKSYLTTILMKIIMKRVHMKLLEIEKERNMNKMRSEDDQSLNTSMFFFMNKQKNSFEIKMKKLLKQKITFWEQYKEGFNSYEDLIRNAYHLITGVFTFKKKLESSFAKTSKDNLIALKFYSIFHCIILNQIHKANKDEDEIENLKKRFIRINKENLSPLSFLEDNLVTCEASFLHQNGKILEKSKNEKLARFFGFNAEEIKNLGHVTDLMPETIAKKHHDFFLWKFSMTRKEQINDKNQIFSFAIDKNKFVFPIKLFLGNSLQYFEDYVIHAAIMKANINESECLLFEKSGLISSCTKSFFRFFQESYPLITQTQLKMLNIHCFIPRIREIIKNNQLFENETSITLRNLNANFLFPENLLEIVEALQFHKDHCIISNEKNMSSIISTVRTVKSFRTINSKRTDKSQAVSAKLNNFLSIYNKKFNNGSLNSKKDFLLKMFDEENIQEGNESFIEGLFDWRSFGKRRINFDLSLQFYKFSKRKQDVLLVCWLKINDLGSYEIANDNDILRNSQEQTVNEIPDLTSVQAIELPPENEAKFNFEFERGKNGSFFSEDAQKKKIIEIINENNDIENNENNKIMKNFYSLQPTQNDINQSNINASLPAQIKKTTEDIIKTKSAQLSINSSVSKEKEKRRLEDLKGETTDKNNMIFHIEAESQKASSVSTLKRSYAIFSTIKMIQDKLPKSVFFIIFSLIFQIILLIAYCLIIYFFATSYVTNKYEPLQQAMINQCKTNIGIGISALVINEFDFVIKGYRNLSDFQFNEMSRILNISYHNAKNTFYADRVTEYSFNFHEYLLNYQVFYVDVRNPSEVSTIFLSDMNDNFIEIINLFVENPDFYMNEDVVGVIFRNFPYYAEATKDVRDKIQEEFIGSIGITTNNVILVMSLMICVVFASKIFEFFVFSSYYVKITKIVNIFLRINQKEAFNEIIHDKEILNILQNESQSYLNYSYPEKCLNKKIINLEEDGIQNYSLKKKRIKTSKTKQTKAKTSLFNLRPLSKFRVYLFISITFMIGIGYFLSNYYFWTITADNVANLLQINTMFTNLYIFSTSALNFQKYYIRENAFDDSAYDNNTNYYQIEKNRLEYFFNSFVNRYNLLNQFTTELPQYGLKAQNIVNDIFYDYLIEGDSCITLKKYQKIFEEQLPFCDTIFNRAFQSGLFSMMNQFTLSLSQNPLAPLVNNTVIDQAKNKTAEYMKYLSDDSNIDTIIGDYYLSEALFIFYSFIKDYYSTILSQQTLNLKTFVWTTCIGFSLILFIGTILSWDYLKKIYSHVSWIMALIPYDKLANDEQTNFLIKQYWKEHS